MASAAQLAALRQETFWANRSEVNDAERDYYAAKSGAKVRKEGDDANWNRHSNYVTPIPSPESVTMQLDCDFSTSRVLCTGLVRHSRF